MAIRNPTEWSKKVYNIDLFDKQTEILLSVYNNRRTAVKGCIASGKTIAAALAVHGFLQLFAPAKVFSTAPSARQVDGVLWGEIRALNLRALARDIRIGGELKPVASEWNFAPDWYALGFSSNDPNRFHGWHGRNVLFVIDEGQGIDQQTLNAIENVMADGNARILFLENPSVNSGMAYDVFHSKREFWKLISISAYDTPNVKLNRIVLPGLITAQQVVEWRNLYGVDSDFYRVKVLAEFPSQEPDTLIPLSWVEAAWAREKKTHGTVDLGVDVARYGDDDSVIQPILGSHVPRYHEMHSQDGPQVGAEVLRVARELKAKTANVDIIGVGASVYDNLKMHGLDGLSGVNVAETASEQDKYQNVRTELAFALRDALNPSKPDSLSMDRDEKLAGEMIAVKFRINHTNGKLMLEPKEETKKRLGRSPDRFDALCLAMAGRLPNAKPSAAYAQSGFVMAPLRPRPDWMGY